MDKRLRHLVAGLLVIAAVAAVVAGRWYVIPKRFAVVDPGKVYRCGELQRWPYQRVLDTHGIKTIVNLNFPSSDPSWDELEAAEAARRGIERFGFSMPGDGVAPFEQLEKAAAILADPQRQPVLVHCSAGVNRTNAVCAVYRLKHCGWTLRQTLAECEKQWLSRDENPELFEHLEQYAQTLDVHRLAAFPRVERPASATPATQAGN